jgi:hypothetical protein
MGHGFHGYGGYVSHNQRVTGNISLSSFPVWVLLVEARMTSEYGSNAASVAYRRCTQEGYDTRIPWYPDTNKKNKGLALGGENKKCAIKNRKKIKKCTLEWEMEPEQRNLNSIDQLLNICESLHGICGHLEPSSFEEKSYVRAHFRNLSGAVPLCIGPVHWASALESIHETFRTRKHECHEWQTWLV